MTIIGTGRAILAASLLLTGTAVAQTAEIEAAQASWEQAFATKDGAAAAAVFTEDARLLPPDGPMVEGREAITKFWQDGHDAGYHSLDLGVIAAEVIGDTMIETGTWSIKGPGENGAEATYTGRALVIWKKGEDGAWRMSHDMWVNDPG